MSRHPGVSPIPRLHLRALAVCQSLLAVGAILATASPAWAQTANPDDLASSRARWADATRLIGSTVSIDGVLDESAWDGAVFVTDFIQKDPEEGQPSTLRTEVAFLYDGGSLYVGARMYTPNPAEIRAQVTRRDNPGNSDRLLVSLDSYYDKRTAYTFGVTASGVRIDYFHGSDSERNRDYSFDPVWEAQAHIDSVGWTAEMRIPFSQLRFNPADVQVWGLNMNRFIPARNEDAYWIYIPKQETGWSSRMADLNGISGITPSRRVEVLPYATSNATVLADRDPNDPFDDGRNIETRVGGDFKMGLGPGLTLDATVNPDFGQVDADPAVVNLSAFEVFFPERRPFFTEGARLLQGRGARFYNSRRIGETPRGAAEGAYVDRPGSSTILGAAKVSGRLASGTSVGTLVALTNRAHAQTVDDIGIRGSQEVAPLTGFAIGRVQQEFGRSVSTVGVTLTGVKRDLDRLSPLSAIYNDAAVGVGVDWNLRFAGGTYELIGAAGFSHIKGDSTAILERQQLSSRRFYQRPDANYVTLDSSRTSLTGYSGFLEFEKQGGRHWLYDVGVSFDSPGFEINDAGRLGAADDIDASASVEYRETVPGPMFRNYELQTRIGTGWNFGGVQQYRRISFDAEAEFNNFWRGFIGGSLAPDAQSDVLTRGGPLMKRTNDWSVNAGLFSNRAANTSWRAFAFYLADDIGGSFFSLSGGVSFRPTPQLEFSLDPRYSRSIDTRQYVATRCGVLAPRDSLYVPEDSTWVPSCSETRPTDPVYGGRYIFGKIDQTTISTRLRLNYSFTPDMTLELYAEPFVSSGQYVDFGELRAARTNDLRTYGTDGTTITEDGGTYTVTDGNDTFEFGDPNFNVLSFRSNVVLRWEWRPGSTLFLVWQQNNGNSGDPGERVNLGNYFDAITGIGDNFFAIKVSYWIPVT